MSAAFFSLVGLVGVFLASVTWQISRQDARFDRIDKQFDKIDVRFDRVDKSLEKITDKLADVDKRVYRMEPKSEVST